MWTIRTNTLLNILILIGLFVLFYYEFSTQYSINLRKPLRKVMRKDIRTLTNITSSPKKTKDYNIWLIFTKVTKVSTLSYKFRDLIHNLLNVSSVPLKFNIIVDRVSQGIAENQIADLLHGNGTLVYSFYDIEESARKMRDIVEVMTPHFSSSPGSYYSGALFYMSLGLYRIAPQNQDIAVLLDCDLYFKKDIALLFQEFDSFKPSALFGLAPELSPVYRHVLSQFKSKHKSTFGEPYQNSLLAPNSVHPHGYQGYNSGVVLINLKAQRNSTEFSKIITRKVVEDLTSKYMFRGHLGDQDFYTLAGYVYPHLIQTLNCGFNRQVCTWWRDNGYSKIFPNYNKCQHDVVIYHGNCNTRIPK